MYCGINKIPKGKVLGTEDYCLANGQVRHYGRKSIENKKIEERQKISKFLHKNLAKEQVTLRGYEIVAEKLLRDYKTVVGIINNKKSTDKDIARAEKLKEKYIDARKKLIQKHKVKSELIKNIEEAKKAAEKEAKKGIKKKKKVTKKK